ncbi:MAG: hypothetical protein DRQ88_12440 [Epsilonproteobacteria bacterium]|nr:MAG: hypothetical protein DRQ88_12440 [Campylobacterota bacterium]
MKWLQQFVNWAQYGSTLKMRWLHQLVNWSHHGSTLKKYKAVTAFTEGKQSTFICGYCGIPFPAVGFENVKLDYYSPKRNRRLMTLFFSIFRGVWIKGVDIRTSIQHFNKVCSSNGEQMTCPNCETSTFMNIIIIKIMKINIGIVL